VLLTPAELHVKMLEPNEEDDEATTLKNWVEQGGWHVGPHGLFQTGACCRNVAAHK
jgi:hypothetical protein